MYYWENSILNTTDNWHPRSHYINIILLEHWFTTTDIIKICLIGKKYLYFHVCIDQLGQKTDLSAKICLNIHWIMKLTNERTAYLQKILTITSRISLLYLKFYIWI